MKWGVHSNIFAWTTFGKSTHVELYFGVSTPFVGCTSTATFLSLLKLHWFQLLCFKMNYNCEHLWREKKRDTSREKSLAHYLKIYNMQYLFWLQKSTWVVTTYYLLILFEKSPASRTHMVHRHISVNLFVEKDFAVVVEQHTCGRNERGRHAHCCKKERTRTKILHTGHVRQEQWPTGDFSTL